MKKAFLLSIAILGMALVAGAQSFIDFTNLPPTNTPYAVPETYGGLHWSGIDYVDCMMWDYANGVIETGDGFMNGPQAQMAFGGGPLCYQKHGGTTNVNICEASISAGIGPNALTHFRPDYMWVAEGRMSDGHQYIIVNAYNNGVQIGSQRYALLPTARKIKLIFPNAWGNVTELKILPSPAAPS